MFACVINSTGQGVVYIAWNDQYSNERLYEARLLLLYYI